MVAYKYELVAYGKTFELTEDSLADPMTHFAVAFHCWMPDCVEADVSPANSVIEDNGVLHVKIPFTVPPVCAPEWGEMGETVRIIQEIIRDMAEANENAGEDAGEKTINGLADACTGEVLISLKRIPLETPKRAFFQVYGDYWRPADVDGRCGVVDGDRVREEITDYIEGCSTSDIEDDVADIICADDDVDIDFYESDSSFSYSKRSILETMGDWETCVSDNLGLLTEDVCGDIFADVVDNCTEEGQTIQTRIGEVTFRLLAVDEDGDPIEE